MKRKKDAMKFQKLQKQLSQTVDRMVLTEIETICNKVIFTHIEPLKEENMYYIVKHADK